MQAQLLYLFSLCVLNYLTNTVSALPSKATAGSQSPVKASNSKTEGQHELVSVKADTDKGQLKKHTPKENSVGKQRGSLPNVNGEKSADVSNEQLKDNKGAAGNTEQAQQQCPQCSSATGQSQQAAAKQKKQPSPQEILGLTEIKPKKPAEVVGQLHVPVNPPMSSYPYAAMGNQNMMQPYQMRYNPYGYQYPNSLSYAYGRTTNSQAPTKIDQGTAQQNAGAQKKPESDAKEEKKAAAEKSDRKDTEEKAKAPVQPEGNEQDKPSNKAARHHGKKAERKIKRHKSLVAALKRHHKVKKAEKQPEKAHKEKEEAQQTGKKEQIVPKGKRGKQAESQLEEHTKKSTEEEAVEVVSGSGGETVSSGTIQKKPMVFKRHRAYRMPVTKMGIKNIYF